MLIIQFIMSENQLKKVIKKYKEKFELTKDDFIQFVKTRVELTEKKLSKFISLIEEDIIDEFGQEQLTKLLHYVSAFQAGEDIQVIDDEDLMNYTKIKFIDKKKRHKDIQKSQIAQESYQKSKNGEKERNKNIEQNQKKNDKIINKQFLDQQTSEKKNPSNVNQKITVEEIGDDDDHQVQVYVQNVQFDNQTYPQIQGDRMWSQRQQQIRRQEEERRRQEQEEQEKLREEEEQQRRREEQRLLIEQQRKKKEKERQKQIQREKQRQKEQEKRKKEKQQQDRIQMEKRQRALKEEQRKQQLRKKKELQESLKRQQKLKFEMQYKRKKEVQAKIEQENRQAMLKRQRQKQQTRRKEIQIEIQAQDEPIRKEQSKQKEKTKTKNSESPCRLEKQRQVQRLKTIEEEKSEQIRLYQSNKQEGTRSSNSLEVIEDQNKKELVTITQFDKVGQDFMNPVIKYKIVYKEKFVTWRRYSEIQKLMTYLRLKYEGIVLPEMPPKEGIKGNLSYFWRSTVNQQFLDQRKDKLKQLLNRLLMCQSVGSDEILLKFLEQQQFQLPDMNQSSAQSYIQTLYDLKDIVFNYNEIKDYGFAYYKYLSDNSNKQIKTECSEEYKKAKFIIQNIAIINEYRQSMNQNFEKRRQIMCDSNINPKGPVKTDFDRLLEEAQIECHEMSLQYGRYVELKSTESWYNELIKQKNQQGGQTLLRIKESYAKTVERIGKTEKNLLESIKKFSQKKQQLLQKLSQKMIVWRKKAHP